MSKFKSACIFSTLAAIILLTPLESVAAGVTVRAKFSFDALADCQQPAVTSFPVHGEGTGTLSTDRTATLDMHLDYFHLGDLTVGMAGSARDGEPGLPPLRGDRGLVDRGRR